MAATNDGSPAPKKKEGESYNELLTPEKLAKMITDREHEQNFLFEAFGISADASSSPKTGRTSKMWTENEWKHFVYLLDHYKTGDAEQELDLVSWKRKYPDWNRISKKFKLERNNKGDAKLFRRDDSKSGKKLQVVHQLMCFPISLLVTRRRPPPGFLCATGTLTSPKPLSGVC